MTEEAFRLEAREAEATEAREERERTLVESHLTLQEVVAGDDVDQRIKQSHVWH
jgi:hypothetical protein